MTIVGFVHELPNKKTVYVAEKINATRFITREEFLRHKIGIMSSHVDSVTVINRIDNQPVTIYFIKPRR